MDVIKHVKHNMIGRMADEQMNVTYLLEVIKHAGDGNYLEIGVLHGGTLCAVGMLKQELGQKGQCIGVDPLDGYYMDYIDVPKRGRETDPVTGLPVDLETVKENIKGFGLSRRCQVVKAKSNPLPEKVAKMEFAVTYIDGDHWGDAPYQDFMNVKDITTGFIVFDNCDDKHPDVLQACHQASQDAHWSMFLRTGITYVLARNDA